MSDVIYNYTNVTGQPYYADQVEVTPGGAGLQETLDLNSGGHDLMGDGERETLTSLGDDTMTGSATGSTTFVLDAVYGADTIANLTGSDIVSMPTSEFPNFTRAFGRSLVCNRRRRHYSPSDGDTLTLDGIATSAQLKEPLGRLHVLFITTGAPSVIEGFDRSGQQGVRQSAWLGGRIATL